jgi:hypothetical protein
MRRAAVVRVAAFVVLYELPLYELPLYEFTLNSKNGALNKRSFEKVVEKSNVTRFGHWRFSPIG